MNLILIFVVLPLATIIFSIALQRLLKCPILVAAVVFAIFLILTYTVFGTDFLIFAILFGILAFITAFITKVLCKIIRRISELERRNSDRDCDCTSNCCNDNDELLTISSRCGNNGEDNRLLTISTGGTCANNNNNDNNNCNCGCNNNNSNCNCGCNANNDRIFLNAEIEPSNNGRSGAFRGCFRRRW